MNVLAGKRLLIVEDTTIAATFLARELKNMQVDVVGAGSLCHAGAGDDRQVAAPSDTHGY